MRPPSIQLQLDAIRLDLVDVFEDKGYDGVFEAGMTICLESYMGEDGGAEGVKLEQQVLITDNGIELLSTFPYEEALLLNEI